MEYQVFYKKNESLKESVSKLRLTNSRPYTQYFITDHAHIEELVYGIEAPVLLFYFTEKMTDADRSIIQTLASSQRHVHIVLFSTESFALSAWRMDIFHFDAYPILSDKLSYAYNKWIRIQENNNNEELVIKTDEGIFKIKHCDILYLQAAGNYTMIHQSGDKITVLTRQLGTFSELSDTFHYFKRVHRSLIFNFQNLKASKNNLIYFYKSKKPLEVSQLLESKVKKIMLGNE